MTRKLKINKGHPLSRVNKDDLITMCDIYKYKLRRAEINKKAATTRHENTLNKIEKFRYKGYKYADVMCDIIINVSEPDWDNVINGYESVNYEFNLDGTVNWRKMVKPEHLVPNKDRTSETDVTKLKDYQLIILFTENTFRIVDMTSQCFFLLLGQVKKSPPNFSPAAGKTPPKIFACGGQKHPQKISPAAGKNTQYNPGKSAACVAGL